MDRRKFVTAMGGCLGAAGLSQTLVRPLAALAAKAPQSPEANAKVTALIESVLKNSFEKINTDWDGSIRIEGLLRFARHGNQRAGKYAHDWLTYHIEHDGKLTDEQYYQQYTGARVRILRGDPLTLGLYSANLGVAFPAYEIYRQTGDEQARKVCLEVANAILQFVARDRFGMLSDDGDRYKSVLYAIPDATYWATRACAIAGELSEKDKPGAAELYWQQSIFQLEQGIKYFFDPEKKLVRTGLFNAQPAKTYWCRSQGWLIWSIAGLLRQLPKDHPKFASFAGTMNQIAEGVARVQTARGGLHVLVDDPSTPEDVTGIAMVTAVVREGMQKGWIPNDHQAMCGKAWSFILESIDAQGGVHNAYTGWAAPAEFHETQHMDEIYRGFVTGILLVAADAMVNG